MQAFELLAPQTAREALRMLDEHKDARFIAGGTTVIDLMKCGAVTPTTLIDITALPFEQIDADEKRIRVGALVRNSDVAYHGAVASKLPMLAQAFLAGASPQLRNMATVGGNLLQRTRCAYFRDPSSACNKRHGGDGCDAFEGYHRMHAILGASDACIATHASDAAVALLALDAIVEVIGSSGTRRVPLEEFYRVPGTTPWLENALEADELITAVEIPLGPAQQNSVYLKVRDRASYEFALVSVAAGLELDRGKIAAARLALGGVATIPWRVRDAETELGGKTPSDALFAEAAQIALEGAIPRRDNAFKLDLAQRAVVRALQTVSQR
ncbi:MAG: FAD binding domain-containing protein [Polyangiaceae bacterium]